MHTSKHAIATILVCCTVIFFSYTYYKKSYLKNSHTPILQVTPTPILEDGPWVWQHTLLLDGKKVTPEDSQKFIMTFTRNSREVTSTTDCNSISSTYIQNGEILSFKPFIATKMFCEKSQEAIYTQELSLATSYTVSSTTLTINLNRDVGTMIFMKPGTFQTTAPDKTKEEALK
jgi:heat shock protein HslJ